MSVETCVPCSSSQILAISERDVFSFRIFKALCKAEVNNVYVVFGAFGRADQEVVWFNVTVNDTLLVNFLNTLDLKKYGVNFVKLLTICDEMWQTVFKSNLRRHS